VRENVPMAKSAPVFAPLAPAAEPSLPPKPPGHLRADTRRWWSEVVADYDGLESHPFGC
jgi:hypothetical protein